MPSAVTGLTVEHQHRLDLGDVDRGCARTGGVLGVDVHERGVAVIGDVGRLVVGQPVVERHGGGAELAGRVHELDDADRVLAAPHDLVAGCTSWSASTWASWLARASSAAYVSVRTCRRGGRRRRRASRVGPRRTPMSKSAHARIRSTPFAPIGDPVPC